MYCFKSTEKFLHILMWNKCSTKISIFSFEIDKQKEKKERKKKITLS